MPNPSERLINLTFQIGRHLRRQMLDGLTDGDRVSPYQLQALKLLAQGLTMSGLAEELGISLPSATSLVDRLVDHGWALRVPDEQDRRIVRIQATPQGTKVLEEMKAKRQKSVAAILATLEPQDVVELERIFTKVITTLDKRKG